MKTNDELRKIAEDIAVKVKGYIKLQGMSATLTHGGRIRKESLQLTCDLINEQHLEEQEEIKVAKIIRNVIIFGVRKVYKEQKKLQKV